MKLPLLHTVALACALVLPGCAMLPSGGTRDGAPATRSLASQDVHFLQQAAHSGHAEIEGSRMAQAKATSPQVRSYAERMIQDHTRVNGELAKLAASKGVTVPQQPSPAQQSRIRALSALSGEAFDRAYLDQMGVMAHENTLSLFRLASTNAQDAEVKAFATRTLPALAMHLDMAKQFQGVLGR